MKKIKRYKCLNSIGYSCIKRNNIYNSDYLINTGLSVEYYAHTFPNDWELIEDFTLPDKWYIKVPNEEDCKLYWDYFNTCYIRSLTGFWYYTSNKIAIQDESDVIQGGYTKITINEFKKYVLKLDDMEKEIIGYKLKENCKQYDKAAARICGVDNNIINRELAFYKTSPCEESLIEAGVLDLWFEPVYKPKYELPDIGPYKGSVEGHTVKYGCKSIDIACLIELQKLRVKSIEIDRYIIRKDTIDKIIDYFNNK